jgi:hypothetical protein
LSDRRFRGSVEFLACVHVLDLVAWIETIRFEAWPQQSRSELKPAMVTDLAWHRFGAMSDGIVAALMELFPSARAHSRMLSAVMPGHRIEPHMDQQSDAWLCRVHCPLTSNDESSFVVAGSGHVMRVGQAYMVNVLVEHSVTNDGETPRIHLMFDVEQT